MCDGETASTLVVCEADSCSTVISEQQMCVEPEQVAELATLIASLHDQFDWISLSGTLPPGALNDSYAAVCKAAHPAKLGLHIRDSVLGELAHQNAELLYLDRIGSPADARSACQELRRRGNRIVVIIVDEQSAVGCDADQCWLVTKNVDAALDPDVMFGTLLAAFMDGQPLRSALTQGIAAGCARGETFEALLPYISIQALP